MFMMEKYINHNLEINLEINRSENTLQQKYFNVYKELDAMRLLGPPNILRSRYNNTRTSGKKLRNTK